jgi:hypothetical protein
MSWRECLDSLGLEEGALLEKQIYEEVFVKVRWEMRMHTSRSTAPRPAPR